MGLIVLVWLLYLVLQNYMVHVCSDTFPIELIVMLKADKNCYTKRN